MNRGMSLEEDVQRMKDEVFFLRIEKVVLVEDVADKPFWTFTLDEVIKGKFEIFPFVNHPTYDTTGKSALIKYYSPFTASDFIICVDSDYEYLLENKDLIKLFIFQTYTYSFENYICYPEGIKNVLEKAIDTEGVEFDFVDYFKRYSEGIYDLLLCSLYSEKLKDGQLSIHECVKQAGFIKIENIEQDLDTLILSLKQFTQPFLKQYQSNDFEHFKKRLEVLGLNKETTFLFFQGKDGLKKKVVIPLMQAIGDPIYNEKLNNFKKIGDIEALKQYNFAVKSKNYETRLLESNRSFQTCFLYQKLLADLKNQINQTKLDKKYI